MALTTEYQKRHIAYKVAIRDILSGEYVKGEGWEPNFINLADIRVSRVDVMASVINVSSDASSSSFIIDDGSDQILCRAFEQSSSISQLSIGDMVHIIGKPRDYNGERYILPEIVRKIEDSRWLSVRKNELIFLASALYSNKPRFSENGNNMMKDPESIVSEEIVIGSEESHGSRAQSQIISQSQNPESISSAPSSTQPSMQESKAIQKKNPTQEVIDLIRSMDQGKGVDLDELVKASSIVNCEQVIDHLLKEGEIFEIMPGKLKVLE